MKITCDKLADDLYDLGLDVLTLHSDLEQNNEMKLLFYFQINHIQF